MSTLFKKIKGDDVAFQIAYNPHPATRNIESFAAKLAANRVKDAARRATSLGPHLDECQFLLDGKTLRSFGSTGQCRLGALCLKLAAVKLLGETDGGSSGGAVALVDDVTGELDQRTRDAFFQVVSSAEQTFFTFTEPPSDSYFKNATVLNVCDGTVSPRPPTQPAGIGG